VPNKSRNIKLFEYYCVVGKEQIGDSGVFVFVFKIFDFLKLFFKIFDNFDLQMLKIIFFMYF
jgi:hypothetical protein